MNLDDPAVKAKLAAIAGSAKHGKQVCVVVSLGDKDTATCRDWSSGVQSVLNRSEKIRCQNHEVTRGRVKGSAASS